MHVEWWTEDYIQIVCMLKNFKILVVQIYAVVNKLCSKLLNVNLMDCYFIVNVLGPGEFKPFCSH